MMFAAPEASMDYPPQCTTPKALPPMLSVLV